MNFKETYRAMNAPIVPSPALVQNTLARTRRRALPLRRLAAAALTAALVLATPALAVRTELGYQLLYALAPAAAQFFQPVQLRCEDNGVTMEVVSVQVEGSTAQAYIALSGEAVDGVCDLFDSYSFHLPFDQIGHCERAGYDPETHTALFLCTTETMDGTPIRTRGKMTFSLGCFLSGREKMEDCLVDLALQDFSQEAETVPFGPESEYSCSGGSYSDESAEELWSRAPMLRPGEALAKPVSGMFITAAGYADGLFHVQLCREDATELDNHGWLWLEDENGECLSSLYSAGFRNSTADGGRLDYDQYAFDVAPEDLGRYTLHGDFTVYGARTEGPWRVTFPLENGNG